MIMNKVYKLVWSKVRNCYVVASELAKNHSKSKSGRTAIIGGILATAVLGLLPVDMVSAAIPAANQPLINGSGAGPSAVAITLGDNTTGVLEVTAGNHSFALGDGAVASNWLDIAMGDGTKASGGYSLATGVRTEASGAISTAMGKETKATGSNATAMGWKSEATSDEAFAVGYQAKANGQWSVAMGLNAEATTEGAIAIGASTEAGYHGFSGGSYSKALGMGSVALGGGKTEHDAQFSFAVGRGAVAKLTNSVALGGGSVAKRAKGKVGYDPLNSTMSAFNRDNHNADTTGVWKSTENAIAVGDPDNKITRQITGVAAGSEDTDAVNVAQLKALRSDLQTDAANGKKTHYYSIKSSAQDANSNYNNDGAKGENALAAGSYASALKDSVAVGHEAQANDMRSVAIGMGAKTFSKADSQAAIDTGGGNTAIGYNAQAGAGDQSGLATAVGKDAKATGWGSSAYGVGADAHSSWSTALGNQSRANETKGIGGTAIGTTAKADEAYATAVGLGAEATAVNSTALGMQAKATQKDSVALGAGSVDRAATKETKGTIALSDGTIRDYGNFAGSNPIGVVSVGAKDKERQIINVAAGKISADSTDAVNGSQLYSLAGEVGKNAEAIAKNTQDISNIKNNITNLTTEAGKHTTVKAGTNKNLTVTEGTNTEGGKEYTVDLSDKLTIGKAGADGKDGHMGINGKDGVSGVGIDGKDGISVKGDKGEVGINGNDGISIKGKDGKDAVSINGKDGVGHIGLTGPAGTNGKDGTNAVDISVKNGYDGADGTKGSSGVDGKDGMTRIVYEDKTGEHQVATLDDGMKYGGDTGDVIKKKLNNQVNVIGGISDTGKLTTTDNVGVVSDGTDNLKVRLAKNLNLGNDGSVTTGDTTINNNGVTIHNGPSITKDGIDAGGKTITNIANGTNATDAVNKGQLDEAMRNTSSEVNRVARGLDRLDSRVNKVGAHAAALAALHPLDYDRDNKLDFAAGIGGYRGKKALAVGAFYRPNSRTMLSFGGSTGGGENMINFGVSVKTGPGNVYEGVSKAQLIAENEDLKRNDAIQDQKIQDQDQKIQELMKMVAELQQKVK